MTRTVLNSTAYFNRLVELLINTKVTDLHGNGLSLDEGMDRAVELINGARPTSAKVMVIGNGGSAAIASHLQNDLSKAVGVRSLVFNEPSLLTALSNDHGYSCIFERPIQMWAEKGDVLVAISSSGRSENIICGAQAAEEKGCHIITLSGFKPNNPLRKLGNLNFYIASESYGQVEVAHSTLTHLLSDMAMARSSG